MPRYITTYDITAGHDEMLECANPYGWFLYIISDDRRAFRLPHTTFVGNFGSLRLAEEAFVEALDAARAICPDPITLTRAIVVDFDSARFLSDDVRPLYE